MGRYGMAGNFYRRSGYVTLQDVPDPNRVYVESFKNLAGGINKFDLPYHLKGNESPFMQNMSWHNGTLTSRLGQVEQVATSQEFLGCAQFLFHGWLLAQMSNGLLAVKVRQTGEATTEANVGLRQYMRYVPFPSEIGVFYLYRSDVYFKAKGGYYKITWSKGDDTLTLHVIADAFQADVSLDGSYGFVPLVQKNSVPASGAGLLFQQENRLSYSKKIQYNGDGQTLTYQLPPSYVGATGFEVTVDGAAVTLAGHDYENGTFTFSTAPAVGQNNVEIKFSKKDTDSINALKSILDTNTMITFGGAQDLCIVVGGPDAQPNAYFWSGNNGLVMDPTYFPMNQYNLAGDNDDPIMAFGKQQNMLVIFQPHATGRAVFGTETLDGLVQVTMNYTRINAEIGCDLPGSLQLVENNLVWCNRRYGVCRLRDSSAAYENNITVISRKINGDYRVSGLLEQLKTVADDAVRSTDTGKRYILVLGDGKAYEWNYELGKYEDPSWFYHTGILGVGFVPLANDELYEVTADGKVCTFEPVFSDFGTTAIEKIYDSPPRDFNSYDRVKNIKSMLFTTRGDSPCQTQISYSCDYGSRVDANDLVVTLPAGATQGPYPKVFRRTPGYHNIHHLAFRLYNNTAGDDLNLISAEIYYEYRGRTR